MAIGHSKLTDGADGTSTNSYTTASISPTGNRLLVLAVESYESGGAPEAPNAVKGNSLTWVKIDSQQTATDTDRMLTLYRAFGPNPTSGTITIEFDGTMDGCLWSVSEFSGVNDDEVQSAKNSGAGTSITATLSAFADASNATYAAFAGSVDENISPGSGFTEITDQTGSSGRLATEWKNSADTTADFSESSSASMAVIALEIAQAGSGLVVEVDGTAHSIKAPSLSIRRRVFGRSTASFVVVDPDANASIKYRNPVVVRLDGRRQFVGWVDSVESRSWHSDSGSSEGMFRRVDCIDNHYLLDKRVVFDEWTSTAAGTIVEGIIDDVLGPEENVLVGTIDAGLTLDKYRADRKSAADVFDELASMSGYYFDIDFDRVVTFTSRPSSAVGSTISGTDLFRETVKLRNRNPSYRNVEHVIGEERSITAPTYQNSEVNDTVSNFSGHAKYPGSQIVVDLDIDFFVKGRDDPGTPTVEVNAVDDGPVERDDQETVPSANWYYEHMGQYFWRDSSAPTLNGSDTVKIRYVSMQNSGEKEYETHNGDGSKRYFELSKTIIDNPSEGYDKPRIEVKLSGATYYSVKTVAEASAGTSAEWYWDRYTNTVWQDSSETVLASGDTLRVSWINEVVQDAVFSDGAEIAAQKDREGGTTSGIVEHVMSDFEADSQTSLQNRGSGELNRWAQQTTELEFETWLSEFVTTTVRTINLPDYGLSNEDFFVQWVEARGRDARGSSDTKSSPLIYRVSLVKNDAAGATGGSVGRSTNPSLFSDLYKEVNDRTRIRSIRSGVY